MDDYNGWANKATWLVKLWIDNDQWEQRYWLDVTRSTIDTTGPTSILSHDEHVRFELAEQLKETFEENMPNQTGFWADLMTWALATVDWDEVAKALIEDASEVPE